MKTIEKKTDINEKDKLLKDEKERVFDRRFYDIKGQIKHLKIIRFGFYMFVIFLIIGIYIIGFYKAGLNINDLTNIELQKKLLISIYQYLEYYINIYINYQNLDNMDKPLKYALLAGFVVWFLSSLVLYIVVKKRSKIQSVLSSLGLAQQFYLLKQNSKKNEIILKLFKGEILDFDAFLNKQEDLKQLLGYDVIQASRFQNDKVLIKYFEDFPSVEDLKDLNVKDFIKEGKIFLGIGVPDLNSKLNKKQLIKGKYEPKYIDFTDLPQGIGNFGGSGFGKSNTLNQLFQSFFINFDKIQAFIFCDFKQGIEAEPYRLLEESKKTGRIFTLEDDRLKLLNLLEKMLIITKSRGLYLKSKGLKKITNRSIILFFDEMAEILDYNPQNKEEREIQNRISSNIETLLRIGRAAGIKIGYSTQSAVQNASGLTSGMKNNTPFRLTHGLANSEQVRSVYDGFEEYGINPQNYDIGRCAIVNLTNSTVIEVRSLYVPEDFTDDIVFGEIAKNEFDEEIKEYYKKYIDSVDNNTFYFDKNELLDDLSNDNLVSDNLIVNENKENKKENRKIPLDSELKINEKNNTNKNMKLQDIENLINFWELKL